MLVAFVGLASSHPFTDAPNLREHLPDVQYVLADTDPERVNRFVRENPGTEVTATADEALARAVDGCVLTERPDVAIPLLGRALDVGSVCFLNKPAAVTGSQLADLESVVAGRQHRVLTSSVLRFSPQILALGPITNRTDVLCVRATVRHDVGWWLGLTDRWQDAPLVGGGTLATMGLHGLELVATCVGPDLSVEWAQVSTRRYHALTSEDTAVIGVRWSDGLTGIVEVLGWSDQESYELVIHRADGDETIAIGAADDRGKDPYGFSATMARFADMLAGAPSPVPWEQTASVLRAVVTARSMTR